MGDPQPHLPLVDVHAHLYDEAFERDLQEVIDRAERRGVLAVLTVGETLEEAQQILSLAKRYPIIKPCAGLYPTVLDVEAAEKMAAFIRQHREGLVAIGEVGLSGELRSASQIERRIAEVARLGFSRCLIPKVGSETTRPPKGVELIAVGTVREAVNAALLKGKRNKADENH